MVSTIAQFVLASIALATVACAPSIITLNDNSLLQAAALEQAMDQFFINPLKIQEDALFPDIPPFEIPFPAYLTAAEVTCLFLLLLIAVFLTAFISLKFCCTRGCLRRMYFGLRDVCCIGYCFRGTKFGMECEYEAID
jgi:hypothetical protein